MSKKPRNPLAGHKGVGMFEVDNGLRNKIGKDVDLRKEIFTKDRIAQSQQLLDDAAAEFLDDASGDIDEMHAQCLALESQDGHNLQHIKTIGELAARLKGQGETLGYELVAMVSQSLIQYCNAQSKADETAAIVIRKHVDTLRVAFHQRLMGDGGETGRDLTSSLEKLIQKFSR